MSIFDYGSDASRVGEKGGMIHYITAQGLGDAWVGNEISVMQAEHIPVALHAMRRSGRRLFESDWAVELNRNTWILYPLPMAGFVLSIMLGPVLFGGAFFSAILNALVGERESLRARIGTLAHFFVACHWARQLRKGKVSHIHSQWAHSPGSIGMYGAWLLGVSFSFTGHAADLFRNRVALRDKIRRAEFIICISNFHREFYLREGARKEQLYIAYCGINPELFSPMKHRRRNEPYRILGAGRIVEKKGFAYLVDACRLLVDRGREFECVIAGSGELEQALRERILGHGLGDRVLLTGRELTQEQIPEFMHDGDIYCLPCVWAADNDVDGLPQLLMEAMACEVPVISTRLVGIPDLIKDGETGLLVEPNNARQLADAIESMMDRPKDAARLAQVGRAWVVERFEIRSALQPLVGLFRAKISMSNANGSVEHQIDDNGATDYTLKIEARE